MKTLFVFILIGFFLFSYQNTFAQISGWQHHIEVDPMTDEKYEYIWFPYTAQTGLRVACEYGPYIWTKHFIDDNSTMFRVRFDDNSAYQTRVNHSRSGGYSYVGFENHLVEELKKSNTLKIELLFRYREREIMNINLVGFSREYAKLRCG